MYSNVSKNYLRSYWDRYEDIMKENIDENFAPDELYKITDFTYTYKGKTFTFLPTSNITCLDPREFNDLNMEIMNKKETRLVKIMKAGLFSLSFLATLFLGFSALSPILVIGCHYLEGNALATLILAKVGLPKLVLFSVIAAIGFMALMIINNQLLKKTKH